MEFVIVRFDRSKTVFVDGSPQGVTNTVQRVDAGPHTFDLGPGNDYEPDHMDRDVQGTDFDHPLELAFIATAAVAMVAPPPPAKAAPKKKKKAPRPKKRVGATRQTTKTRSSRSSSPPKRTRRRRA
jgi:hypothetical protein